jgi:hypothetical protein
VFLIQLPGITGGMFYWFPGRYIILSCAASFPVTDGLIFSLFTASIYPTRLKLNKRKNKKCHTVETVSKSNQNFIETGKIYTPNTHIHDRSLSLLGTGTSVKVAGLN